MIARTARGWLAATLIAFIAAPGLAQEQEQDSTPAAFAKALASLTERLGTIETGPDIETTDTAANAADLAVIEQALDMLGTPAFPLDGFATFESVCEPINRLSVRHGLDGLSAFARPPGSPPPTPDEMQVFMGKMQVLQLRNAARYPDEITVLSGGVMRCMVKHFPALTAFVTALPKEEITLTRLKGAYGMRLGGAQALVGFMISLRDPTISPANKARLNAYVAEVAAPLSAVMTPALRTEFAARLENLPPTQDAEVLATTALVKAALADTTCEGLCRY